MDTEKGNVQALDRAFTLLELLCKSRNGMSIHELSERTGLHKSTVHRLLNSMAAWGYVRRAADSVMYCPGMKLCEMGEYIQQNLDVVAMARGTMEQLSRWTEETVHLVMRDGNEIVYIYKVESIHGAIRMVSRIGMRRPMYCTGVGKAILATCTDEDVHQCWESTPIIAHTPRTIVKEEAFFRELRLVRDSGYAMDNEENELGVRCIAAAIPDWHGEANYALSISAPVTRFTDERIQTIIPKLLEVCRQLSHMLGAKTE